MVAGGPGHRTAAEDARLLVHLRRLAGLSRRVVSVCTGATLLAAAGLVSLAEAGTLTLRVAETMPLDRVADAHLRLAKGGLRGRIVLVP